MTTKRLKPLDSDSHTNKIRYVVAAPEVGKLTPIAPGVYLLRLPMDLGLDHINVYLLEDNDGWYVVDTGLASKSVKAIWLKVIDESLGGKPLKGLICTHFHYDHASLAGWMMEQFNIPLYMSSGEYLWMRALATSRHQRVDSDLRPYYLSQDVPEPITDEILQLIEHDPLSGLYPSSFQRVRDGDVFHIKGKQWEVVMGEGHSPEHICLYDAQSDLLIAGDQLLPEISSSIFVNEIEPLADPLRGWLSSLNKLSALPNQTQVLPAHGGVFVGVHQRTAEIRELHDKRLKQVVTALEEYRECSLYLLMRYLFNREMSAMNIMLALGETAAHVNYLLSEKTVEKQIGTDGKPTTYRLSLVTDSIT